MMATDPARRPRNMSVVLSALRRLAVHDGTGRSAVLVRPVSDENVPPAPVAAAAAAKVKVGVVPRALVVQRRRALGEIQRPR